MALQGIVHRTKKDLKQAMVDNVFNCLNCDRSVRQTQKELQNSCDKLIDILRNNQSIVELHELQMNLAKCIKFSELQDLVLVKAN